MHIDEKVKRPLAKELHHSLQAAKPIKKVFRQNGLVNFMHDITFGKGEITMLVRNDNIFSYYKNNKIPMLCTNEQGRKLEEGIYINQCLEDEYRDCSVLMPLMVTLGKKFGEDFGNQSLHVVKREKDCQHLYSLFFDLKEHHFIHGVVNNGYFISDLVNHYDEVAKNMIIEAKLPHNRITLPDFNVKTSHSGTQFFRVIHKDAHIPIVLSRQQGRCLIYLTLGQSAKQIAREMAISPRTVEHYLLKIRRLLGCNTNKELIAFYSNQIRGFM